MSACARACVRAYVRACVRACVRVCVCAVETTAGQCAMAAKNRGREKQSAGQTAPQAAADSLSVAAACSQTSW